MGRPHVGALPSGHYPIECGAGEIERLRMQAAAMAFNADVMLDRIGVQPGWRCLDLGCGAGGILELLGPRVGPVGLAIGLDADVAMLQAARRRIDVQRVSPVTLVAGDAYGTAFRPEVFDLVHVRFVASTAGLGDELLREALALARPGGVLALRESDTDALSCFPPHPAWERLKKALQDGFTQASGETFGLPSGGSNSCAAPGSRTSDTGPSSWG
jgi:ubiquinone/menaquinone biosynthesis C-methylase UbiE